MNVTGPYVLDLETQKLRLRALRASDEAFYRELYTDPKIMRYIAPPLSTEGAVSSFRKLLSLQREWTLKSRALVIEEKATAQLIGMCGTSKYDAVALSVELGIVLTPEASARGLAKEALTALMKKVFSVSPMDEIWVECSTLYPAVEHLVVAVGFTPCGNDQDTTGPLANRVWSVRRSSWYGNQSTIFNQQSRGYACRT